VTLTPVFANLGDIGGNGVAIKQAVDMFNYVQRQTAHSGETVYQYTHSPQVIDPATGAIISPGQITAESFVATEDGELVGKNFTVTGHSTGGHLALVMSRLLPGRVDAVTTYAAPGFDVAIPGTEKFLQLLHDAQVAAEGSSQIIAETDGGFANPTIPSIINLVVPEDSLADIGTKPGQTVDFYTEGEDQGVRPNHSIREMSDALAVSNLFSTIDQDIDLSTASKILEVASNEAEASLETVVTALGELFNPSFNADSRLAEVEVAVDDRERLYTNLFAIQDSLAQIGGHSTLTVTSLVSRDAGELKRKAEGEAVAPDERKPRKPGSESSFNQTLNILMLSHYCKRNCHGPFAQIITA